MLKETERNSVSRNVWSYFFTHPSNVEKIRKKLDSKFETFVHTRIMREYDHDNRLRKIETQSISGLIFVKGVQKEVQSYLQEYLKGHYLVKDCATGMAAQIENKEMRAFMRIASLSECTLRFLVHDIDYYSKGHPKIRVTEGLLEGIEGYIVRISRDRFLVTGMGNMTIAISGAHKCKIENVEEYIACEKEQKYRAIASLHTTVNLNYIRQCKDEVECLLEDGYDEKALSLSQRILKEMENRFEKSINEQENIDIRKEILGLRELINDIKKKGKKYE